MWFVWASVSGISTVVVWLAALCSFLLSYGLGTVCGRRIACFILFLVWCLGGVAVGESWVFVGVEEERERAGDLKFHGTAAA